MDIKQLNRTQLTKLKDQIDQQILAIEEADKQKAIEAVTKKAKEFGFNLEDLIPELRPGKKTRNTAKKAGPPKYANPDDPTQTWSGKGRRPEWFRKALERGTEPEAMEISA